LKLADTEYIPFWTLKPHLNGCHVVVQDESNTSHSRDNMSHSRDYTSHSRDNTSHSRDNTGRK
jgi:hypothetical protein